MMMIKSKQDQFCSQILIKNSRHWPPQTCHSVLHDNRKHHPDKSGKVRVGKYCLRYGIPNALIMDNVPQLKSDLVKGFCEGLHIRMALSSVAQP